MSGNVGFDVDVWCVDCIMLMYLRIIVRLW